MDKEIAEILTFGSRRAADCETVCPRAAAVLSRLMEANRIYRTREEHPARLTDLVRRTTAREGQHPYAAVVTCADSRVPPEHIFGAGIGELFVIRNAGNLMGTFDLASVEYAAEHLETPLVLIMGHRGCGAVAAALSGEAPEGFLGRILEEVRTAAGDTDDPREAERRNLLHSLEKLRESPVLRHLAETGRVGFAAGIYDLESGEVKFLRE